MSATHKTKAERGLDFYETPKGVVDLLIPHLPCASGVLDPCAGKGSILQALAAHPEKFSGLRGIEVDEAHTGSHPHPTEYDDALQVGWGSPRLIVMNPPFGLAQAFVEKALAEVAPGGTVAVLLRLAFLASVARSGFHRALPADVYVLAERPSFCLSVTCADKVGCLWRTTLPTGSARPRSCPRCGGRVKISSSDSADCAWFSWGPGRGSRWVVLGADQ